MAEPVWFWQRIVSPHMAGLAAALAERGREVVYVAEREMSPHRARLGWKPAPLGSARLLLACDANAMRRAAQDAPAHAVHLCQGLRGNGPVGAAQQALATRRARQWVVMERVDDGGWTGPFKRFEYGRLVRRWRTRLQGILAAGHGTREWLTGRGMPDGQVLPFAYFLPQPAARAPEFHPGAPFRFLFVGRIVELKRIDLLIDALETVKALPFVLDIAGTGPLQAELEEKAARLLPGRVNWLGGMANHEIPAIMAAADCLVLPSRYDGWGAVVSEALMAGTRAICSDACGSAVAVRASGTGGVFAAGSLPGLARLLQQTLEEGRQTPQLRAGLAGWAKCLGAAAGAEYLDAILRMSGASSPPTPPWEAASQ
jgi:glycosyltransferase involved in cell wall biosynthesis